MSSLRGVGAEELWQGKEVQGNVLLRVRSGELRGSTFHHHLISIPIETIFDIFAL
jgi:hypothetical protein